MKLDRFRVSDPQKETARAALEQYGYSMDDFEWIPAEEPAHSEVSDDAGTVYVIYKPTGFRRMYEGAEWATEFAEDLQNQIFKPVS